MNIISGQKDRKTTGSETITKTYRQLKKKIHNFFAFPHKNELIAKFNTVMPWKKTNNLPLILYIKVNRRGVKLSH